LLEQIPKFGDYHQTLERERRKDEVEGRLCDAPSTVIIIEVDRFYLYPNSKFTKQHRLVETRKDEGEWDEWYVDVGCPTPVDEEAGVGKDCIVRESRS